MTLVIVLEFMALDIAESINWRGRVFIHGFKILLVIKKFNKTLPSGS